MTAQQAREFVNAVLADPDVGLSVPLAMSLALQ